MRRLLLAAALAAVASAAQALDVDALLGGGRLVAYVPRGDAAAPASPHRLRADADVLARLGFRAVTTYAATRASTPVCRFFKRRGFHTVLVGVADPRDERERRRAVALRRCADGYVVGSGGLAAGRYAEGELAAAVARLRRATGRPVTTREPAAEYDAEPRLLALGDWLFPSVEPWDAGRGAPQDACGWTIDRYRALALRAPTTVPVVVGETGLPSGGALGTSEYYQRAFFTCIESRQVPFAYFVAFDVPAAGDDGVGPHWGLFRADGTPKLWAAEQLAPHLGLERTPRWARGRVGRAEPRSERVVVYVDDGGWRALAPAAIGRRGKWRVRVPAGRPLVAFVVAAGWTPPAGRLPVLDHVHVLARRDGPPM